MTTSVPWRLNAYRTLRYFMRRRLCDLLGGHKIGDGQRAYLPAGAGIELFQCRRCLSLFYQKVGEE